jgi:hypothetical protein
MDYRSGFPQKIPQQAQGNSGCCIFFTHRLDWCIVFVLFCIHFHQKMIMLMKTRTYFFLIVSGLCFCTFSYAQQQWSIRASAGTGFDRKAFEGHYFAFDLGIPVTHYLDIAPTFLGYSRVGERHTGIVVSAPSLEGQPFRQYQLFSQIGARSYRKDQYFLSNGRACCCF